MFFGNVMLGNSKSNEFFPYLLLTYLEENL